ncbi:MAG TPA: ABC transporter ATP-binding protein [Thermoleophilia bacterium]|nr:ABC transporter ATP-binding protein [Thermoleophilia bacterium]
MNQPAIVVEAFRKAYGDVDAVAGIDFTVAEGEIFGLLGPNGAGKTTTLECLEGIRYPTAGTLRVRGIDPSREPGRLRDVIGVQLQTSSLPETMRVEEAMRFFCAYHAIAPRLDLLERLGLEAKLRAEYGTLSTGQQRRLALALALAHEPPVVFLDEPTAGLDVGTRAELHVLVGELRERGVALILATHDMAEAEKLADRVAILLAGRIVATGTPKALTAAAADLTRVTVRSERETLAASTAPLPGVQRHARKDGYDVFFTDAVGPTVTAILRTLEEAGDPIVDLRVERPSLEERFLELTTNGGAA